MSEKTISLDPSVSLLRRSGRLAAVSSGLNVGDRVIIYPSDRIRSGRASRCPVDPSARLRNISYINEPIPPGGYLCSTARSLVPTPRTVLAGVEDLPILTPRTAALEGCLD